MVQGVVDVDVLRERIENGVEIAVGTENPSCHILYLLRLPNNIWAVGMKLVRTKLKAMGLVIFYGREKLQNMKHTRKVPVINFSPGEGKRNVYK